MTKMFLLMVVVGTLSSFTVPVTVAIPLALRDDIFDAAVFIAPVIFPLLPLLCFEHGYY